MIFIGTDDILNTVINMLSTLKNIWKNSFIYKLINKYENRRFGKRLTNSDFTILAPNCIGGVIYSRLGQRFNSPTVNLTINTSDFCSFLENSDYYLSQNMIDGGLNNHNIPVGILKGNGNEIPDIEINFVHYKTFDEGNKKWEQRKTRIIRENTYVIMYDIDNLNEDDYTKVGYAKEEDLIKFEKFECNNKVLLTRNKNCKKPYAVYIEPEYNGPYPLVYLTRNICGVNVFEKHWDYVEFLNKK